MRMVLAVLVAALLVVPAVLNVLPAAQAIVIGGFDANDGVVDAGAGAMLPDEPSGNSDDSYSGGGPKEDDVCPQADFSHAAPQNADLTGWWVSASPGTPGILYLAWERKAQNGTLTVDFELNQNGTLCTANHDRINPVRTDGDILVTYDFQGGQVVGDSDDIAIEVRLWDATGQKWVLQSLAANSWEASISDTEEVGELAINMIVNDILSSDECNDFAAGFAKTRTGARGAFDTSTIKDFIAPTDDIELSNCGKVIVTKQTVPDGNTTQNFDFTASGDLDDDSPTAFDLKDGESQELLAFAGTDVVVTEPGETGWQLTNLQCETTDTVTWTRGTGQNANQVTVSGLDPDEEIECTFTNTKLGSLTIVKDEANNKSRDFGYTTSNLTPANFTLDDDPSSVTPPNTATFGSLLPGTYGVTETAQNDWRVSNISCTGATNSTVTIGSDSDFDTGDRSVSVVLAAGENVTCEFDNVEILPTIEVVKTADPTSVDEPGEQVTYSVTVNNLSNEAVTLNSLSDNQFGNIASASNPNIVSTTCSLPQSLAAATSANTTDSYSCEFVALVEGDATDPDHVNVVTASATDSDANVATDTDDATVGFDDVAPVIDVTKTATPDEVNEPGDDVTFAVVVRNDSAEPVTLTTLTDDVFGNIASSSNSKLVSTTCSLPQSLAASNGGTTDQYSCSFVARVAGDAGTQHVDTVTATAVDDDGTSDSDTDDATVDILDVLPTIAVTKSPTPGAVNEPGGPVTFAVQVTNNSVEPVTLTSLTDSVFGNVTTVAGAITSTTCVLNGTIAANGGTYSCSFIALVSGNGDTVHVDVVTAEAVDNEGNPATAGDDALVAINDVLPTINVTKTPSTTLVRVGGSVTYTYVVTTNGPESLSDVSAGDDKCSPLSFTGGDTDGDGKLDPGEQWRYSCTTALTQDTTNVVTARGSDDEGNQVQATATASVGVVDAVINVDKSADPTGGSPGTPITYTYVVTVPKESLTNVKVTDDQCAPVTYVSGDDGDNVLEPGEQWRYTCTRAADGSAPTNVATATGTDRTGATVQATDTVTIAVVEPVVLERVPELPRTGADSADLAKLAASLVLLGLSLLFVARSPKKRRTEAS